MDIKRGDVVYCSLGIETGRSIQGGDRPVVVVSNDMNNNNEGL